MKQKTHKNCVVCGNPFRLYRTTDKYCSFDCSNSDKQKSEPKARKPIPKVSKKQSVLNAKYTVKRIEYLSRPENKFCFVEDCGKIATTVEHRKGRIGFADEWAKNNNVPLIIDERFFAPCCLFHNLEFERNPELSKKYQLSKLHDGKKGT
mgnify:CR=1 FL=1